MPTTIYPGENTSQQVSRITTIDHRLFDTIWLGPLCEHFDVIT